MPELPEVETVRLGLSAAMDGRRLVRVDQRRPDLRYPFPKRFKPRLEGARIDRLERRGKYLLSFFDRPDVLIMHLGMSGRFTIAPPHDPEGPPGPHDHVVFGLDNGARVTFTDPRRFGFMDLVAEQELTACRHFKAMGPEPLSNGFSAPALAANLSGRQAPLKSALLDQRTVAGLGNIYVCEALYRAGLSPRRKARTLVTGTGRPTKRLERLTACVRDVLTEAIAAGGSSLRDYAKTDGSLGYFQHGFAVYDREGEPCSKPRCTGRVRRIVQANRSTFYCPTCQK